MTNKERFKEIVSSTIKRQGIEKLMEQLEQTDFYTAPASTRYHNDYEGGLVEHSLKVYDILKKDLANSDVPDETVAILALFHDICKIGFYKTEMRNTKVDGKWVQVPYYTIEDKFPYGHGEKSVYMLRDFIPLTVDEAMAIRWHMGGFEPQENRNTMSTAFSQYPLAVMLHIADLKATYINYNEEEKIDECTPVKAE